MQLSPVRKNRFALVLAVSLPAVSLPLIALAPKLAANTIDPEASLAVHGTHIVLTGPIRCTQTEWVDMRVTVTQRDTGAVAEGHLRFVGSDTTQHWTVDAVVRGQAAFVEGPATVVAIAVTSRAAQPTDANQWLVPVVLHKD